MFFWGQVSQKRFSFITDLYWQIQSWFLPDSLYKKKVVTREMMIQEVLDARGCSCGGRCASCRAVIDDVIPSE